jgi:hypothetical protein
METGGGESVCGAYGGGGAGDSYECVFGAGAGDDNRLARVVRETGVTAEGETAGPSLSFGMTAQT